MTRFHFSLNHLQDAQTLQVYMPGHPLLALSAHTKATWSDAKNTHPVLSLVPEPTAQQYQHYADIPEDRIYGAAQRWIQVVRPQQGGSHLHEVVLMAQIISPDSLLAFYKSPMWKERHLRKHGHHITPALRAAALARDPHIHGRLRALGIMPNPTAQEAQILSRLVSLQELVDEQTTAAGLLAHHPNLATVQPQTAAYIRDAILNIDADDDPEQWNAMHDLSKKIEGTPSWSPIINCKDKDGNPIKAGYDLGEFKKGDQLQTFAISSDVSIPAAKAAAGAQRLSSDDMQLKNQMWRPTPGRSVLKSSVPNRTNLEDTQLGVSTRYKWTVPYQTWTDGIEIPKNSLRDDDDTLQIDCYNIYNRTLYVAYELFDDHGKSMGSRQSLGSLSSVDNIMGIPIPYWPTTQTIKLNGASSVKLYFGSLGVWNWDPATWDDMNVSDRGGLLTDAWQYAVPLIFTVAGAVITNTETFNKIVNDKKLVKEALIILTMFVAVAEGTLAKAKLYEQMVQFSNVVISFAVQNGMQALGEWLVEQVGEAGFTKCFGPVGWLFQLVAAGLNVEQMAITTGEVFASDAFMVAELKRAIDVRLTLHPSPSHGEAGHPETAVWPSVATNWVATLQCRGGTNFEVRGALPSTTKGTPIPINFQDVPAGGDFRIFIGLYSKNGWLAGIWQNDWAPAVSQGSTLLDLGDKEITEVLVPLSPDTQYEYKEKISYSDSAFSWNADNNPPSSTLASLKPGDQGGLSELSALTINNSAFQVGMVWRAAQQHLHPDSLTAPVSDKQLYAVQNLSVLENPGNRLKTTQIGFTNKPGIAYAPSTNSPKAIDQNNFILDPRNGAVHLRKVILNDDKSDFGLGDPPLLSWGSFPLDNLDAVVVHPSNAVIACSFSKHKLCILNLPDSPSLDAHAREAKMISGEGLREGLMRGPKALAVAPDGRILVLESINNRVQAFDVKGAAVPSFTPNPWIFTVTKVDVAAKLDQGVLPQAFMDSLIQHAATYVAALPDSGYTEELDHGELSPPMAKIHAGNLRSVNDPGRPASVIEALATLNIQLAYDPTQMMNPKLSAQIQVVTPGKSWIITDPRQHAWQILNQSGMLKVYERPVGVKVEVQKPGNRWLLNDDYLGRAWVLQVSTGDETVVEVFECFTYFPLHKGPSNANLNYLDMAVEAQGYMYVLSYINDGAASTDYLLDVYTPGGSFLFRSPDPSKTTNPKNIVAGRIAVDIKRNLFALPYETLRGPGGGLQPGLAHWTPTTPLFDLPVTKQPDFNTKNISAVVQDFAAFPQNITLSSEAFIEVVDPDGWWQVKDGATLYNVYRSEDKLQVYSIPA